MAETSLTINNDCVGSIIERNLDQFKEKPNWTAVLTAIGNQFQLLEDEFDKFSTLLDINTQTGQTLTILGKIVGLDR